MAIENIVAQDQGDAIRADEVTPDDEGVGETARRLLDGILEA